MPEQRTCTTLRRAAAAGAAALLLAVPAAVGQDRSAPVGVTVSAPSVVEHEGLRKGLAVKVRCADACSARLSLSGRIGVITERTVRVGGGDTRTARLRVTTSQARELAKGSKLTVVARVPGGESGLGETATDTVTVR